jgi:hypothetical protein
MTDEQYPLRFALIEYATNKFFFNVYSALQIERLVVELVRYDREQRCHLDRASAYLSIGRVRLLVHQVLGGLTGDGWKHETFGGGFRDGQVESRIVTFEHDTGQGKFAQYPYRLTIALGAGRRTGTGAITPEGKPHTRVSMRFPADDFVTHCLEIQAFLATHQRDLEMIRYRAQVEKYHTRQQPAVANGRH